jgi:MFS family permease
MILTLTCLASVVSIVGGHITQHLGWRYLFVIHLPFVVTGALSIFFLLPETQFKRPPGYMGSLEATMDELTAAAESKRDVHAYDSQNEGGNENNTLNDLELSRPVTTGSSAEQKKSYLQELALYTGVYSETSFLKLLMAPIAAVLNPAVAWVSVQ